MAKQNYTLGRGKLYFSRFVPGTQQPAGFRYIGNSPEFSLSIETDNLDHFSSDEGIREKDDSIPLEVTRTGSFSTDNVVPENLALFFFGTTTVLTQAPISSGAETIDDAVPGFAYQIGLSDSNHVGVRGIAATGFAVKNGSTTLVEGTDYRIDRATGMLELIEGGSITVATDLAVTYTTAASTRERVISGSEAVEGALRYIANNPKGENFDYILPYVKITPNGDYALKGDEWQVIPFNIEALKPNVGEAIYVDGRPKFA